MKKIGAIALLIGAFLLPTAASAHNPEDAVCPAEPSGYEAVRVVDLTGDERERAEKVDDPTDPRREEGVVCIKRVQGAGNTGEGSNIKDDLPRG